MCKQVPFYTAPSGNRTLSPDRGGGWRGEGSLPHGPKWGCSASSLSSGRGDETQHFPGTPPPRQAPRPPALGPTPHWEELVQLLLQLLPTGHADVDTSLSFLEQVAFGRKCLQIYILRQEGLGGQSRGDGFGEPIDAQSPWKSLSPEPQHCSHVRRKVHTRCTGFLPAQPGGLHRGEQRLGSHLQAQQALVDRPTDRPSVLTVSHSEAEAPSTFVLWCRAPGAKGTGRLTHSPWEETGGMGCDGGLPQVRGSAWRHPAWE